MRFSGDPGPRKVPKRLSIPSCLYFVVTAYSSEPIGTGIVGSAANPDNTGHDQAQHPDAYPYRLLPPRDHALPGARGRPDGRKGGRPRKPNGNPNRTQTKALHHHKHLPCGVIMLFAGSARLQWRTPSPEPLYATEIHSRKSSR